MRLTVTFLEVLESSSDDWIVAHSPPVLGQLGLRWSSEVTRTLCVKGSLSKSANPKIAPDAASLVHVHVLLMWPRARSYLPRIGM